jgi:hypothetical protein
VEDAAAEARRARDALVDVQRIEVAEEPRREDEVRFGHGERRAEGLADRHLVVVLARKH